MDCRRFRHLNCSDAALRAMTRGQRHACVKHWRRCRPCRAWIKRQPPDDPAADNRREAEELARRDLRAGRRLEGG